MPETTPPPVVIVTTDARLSQIVEAAFERAGRRLIADMTAPREADWITSREAARILGRHRSTLLRWRKAGIIESRKVAGSVYFERDSVNRAAQSEPPPAPS